LPDTSSSPPPQSGHITLQWQEVEMPPLNGEPHVGLSLILLGATEKTIQLGTVSGEKSYASNAGEEDVMLDRSWWVGTDASFVVSRKDSTHLVVKSIPLDDSGTEKTIKEIEIPSGAIVDDVDESGAPL
jgi:hypothetical protein